MSDDVLCDCGHEVGDHRMDTDFDEYWCDGGDDDYCKCTRSLHAVYGAALAERDAQLREAAAIIEGPRHYDRIVAWREKTKNATWREL